MSMENRKVAMIISNTMLAQYRTGFSSRFAYTLQLQDNMVPDLNS